MTVVRACKQMRPKPWGVADLGPWHRSINTDTLIGEIWYDRPDRSAATPSLLLKLLFTAQPLSIQVHPDDAFAQSIRQPHGKTEAWYVLDAAPGAKVALGLDNSITPQQLRQSIDDGSIAERVVWRSVSAGDTTFVPAGTIHAIGAGLVIAEIQQRSDATFRLFDYGRQRDLHVDDGVAVSRTEPAALPCRGKALTKERTLLTACPQFVFERVILEPDTRWRLAADRETWLLVIAGQAQAASFDVVIGDAIFAEADHVELQAGEIGMVALVAYAGPAANPNLLLQIAADRMAIGSNPLTASESTVFVDSAAVQASGHNGTVK